MQANEKLIIKDGEPLYVYWSTTQLLLLFFSIFLGIMFVHTFKPLNRLSSLGALRAFATTTPEGIVSNEILDRLSNKKPNKVFHIYSTRVSGNDWIEMRGLIHSITVVIVNICRSSNNAGVISLKESPRE